MSHHRMMFKLDLLDVVETYCIEQCIDFTDLDRNELYAYSVLALAVLLDRVYQISVSDQVYLSIEDIRVECEIEHLSDIIIDYMEYNNALYRRHLYFLEMNHVLSIRKNSIYSYEVEYYEI